MTVQQLCNSLLWKTGRQVVHTHMRACVYTLTHTWVVRLAQPQGGRSVSGG